MTRGSRPPAEVGGRITPRGRITDFHLGISGEGALESDHFSDQLVERVGWAVLDADELERKEGRRGDR